MLLEPAHVEVVQPHHAGVGRRALAKVDFPVGPGRQLDKPDVVTEVGATVLGMGDPLAGGVGCSADVEIERQGIVDDVRGGEHPVARNQRPGGSIVEPVIGLQRDLPDALVA
ncbi:MAG: hypothetical protein WD534_07025 [Phycisphaeraceae bacterium]